MSQTRSFYKKAITKIVSDEYIKPAGQKLIPQKGIIDILNTLDRGTTDELKRIYDKYTTSKAENKPIQSLNKKTLKSNEEKVKKIQLIADKNSKITKEEAERRKADKELPQIGIEDEDNESQLHNKGLNLFMEGNIPQNINDDLDKSIFYMLVHLKKKLLNPIRIINHVK